MATYEEVHAERLVTYRHSLDYFLGIACHEANNLQIDRTDVCFSLDDLVETLTAATNSAKQLRLLVGMRNEVENRELEDDSDDQ
jgi:hypothetical protein